MEPLSDISLENYVAKFKKKIKISYIGLTL